MERALITSSPSGIGNSMGPQQGVLTRALCHDLTESSTRAADG